MLLSIALAAASATEEKRHLPMPPWLFGLLALTVFFSLFLVLWAFRSVGVHHGEAHAQSAGSQSGHPHN